VHFDDSLAPDETPGYPGVSSGFKLSEKRKRINDV